MNLGGVPLDRSSVLMQTTRLDLNGVNRSSPECSRAKMAEQGGLVASSFQLLARLATVFADEIGGFFFIHLHGII